MKDIALRPAVQSDAAFAYLVEEQAMREYAEQTWGKWNPAFDREGHIASFLAAAHQVVESRGRPIGILATEQREDHVFLAKLYLLSDHRNSGVGSNVLAFVLSHAKLGGHLVRLHTLAVNTRAQSFYARHGFKVESRDTERVFMVHCTTE